MNEPHLGLIDGPAQIALGIVSSILAPALGWFLAVRWNQVRSTAHQLLKVVLRAFVIVSPLVLLLFLEQTKASKITQLLGCGVTLFCMWSRDSEFGSPLKDYLWAQWRQLRSIWANRANLTIALQGAASMERSGSARLSARYGHDGSAESRLVALEKNLLEIEKELNRRDDSLEAGLRAASESAKGEYAALRKEIGDLRSKLAETQVGNIRVELVGVAWTILGIVMSK